MSSKAFGLGKERSVKALCYKEGALFASRCRGSFGTFDIIAFFPDKCLLISVKSTKQKYVSYNQELEKIKNTVVPEYCKKQLRIWWSPNKERPKKGWEMIDIGNNNGNDQN